jgi:hypothetical protein
VAYLEVVDLPADGEEENDGLEDGPPLDAVVRRLGRVAVPAFADDDVLLLILDRLEAVGKVADFSLDGCDGAWAQLSDAELTMRASYFSPSSST